ncbi:MAG: adenosyl-hopene transferase HpnH [Nitrospiraceae bacterium]|jgi:hopanoid biosynthesis associated radical SAM protein HpnH|nr:adenosyl-hopene transferase HpnH [Nitrospiraceae bacterium]
MAISIHQAVKVGSYILSQKLRGRRKFPLVLMLEPLFRCNLECAGCGKIQYPEEILNKRLSPEECFRAVDECGAPVVTIAGGEPLIHQEISEIVEGIVARKKFVYLCTNAILLEKHLHRLKPSPYLTLSIHLDGLKEDHDRLVCRNGIFDVAVRAIKDAKSKGFRVTTNSTVFEGENPEDLHRFFDFVSTLKTDGMMISPGYSYAWAPDQAHFLRRERTKEFFKKIFAPMHEKGNTKQWNFNHSPFYLDFLEGARDYDCTPWGSPNYSVLGWQKPCYLLNDGYASSFKELMDTTNWDQYGHKSGNPKCQDCMVHCGFEPSAVSDATSSIKNTIRSISSLIPAG